MKAVACPCCGSPCEVKPDKRGHPYITHTPCGFAGLVHKSEGSNAFKERYGWGKPEGEGAPPSSGSANDPAAGAAARGHRARRG